MKYSVVIPTYNRKETLQLTLGSIIRQTMPATEYEVIIIDDGSIDGTDKVVREFIKLHPNNSLHYFWQENGGPAKARNRGIKEAKGEYIFFTDDDCEVPENWMETLLDGFRCYPEAVGVGGWYKPGNKKMENRYFQKYREFLFRYYYNFDLDRAEIQTNIFSANSAGDTANVVYLREVFNKCGMFDESLIFAGLDDWEFKKRVQDSGLQLLYLPMFVSHYKNLKLKTFIKQCFDRGRGSYYMAMKFKGLSRHRYFNLKLSTIFLEIFTWAIRQPKYLPARIIELTISLIAKYCMIFKKIRPTKYAARNADVERSIKRPVPGDSITRFTRFNKFVTGSKLSSAAENQFYSIIIPTYNRAELLQAALKCLAAQTINPAKYEIIIIDDGSTDSTTDIVEKFKLAHTFLIIHYFYQKNSGPAKARNHGIREAKGEYIFFTDDDCEVPENWMETLLDGFKRYPEAAGVGGWLDNTPEILKSNIFTRYFQFRSFGKRSNQWAYSTLECLSNDSKMVGSIFAYNTGNLCIKKKILEEIGGFLGEFPYPAAEDTDLGFRILKKGHPILFIPFHPKHKKNCTLLEFVKIYFHRGAGHYIFGRLNKAELEEIKPGASRPRVDIRVVFDQKTTISIKLLTFLHFASWHMGAMYASWKFDYGVDKRVVKSSY